jgi:signal transduction histidine kinase
LHLIGDFRQKINRPIPGFVYGMMFTPYIHIELKGVKRPMEITLKILMLEDVVEDVELITRTLKKAGLLFEVRQEDTRDGFIKALDEYDADVILSDHSLPQFNSVEALTIVKKYDIKTPFILVTGAVSEEFAVTCLKEGADDYVLKSNLARLPNAIRNALKQREAEDAKFKAAQALQSQNAELKKINKELDSFVYSVSHNLRAPLMSVLGLLDLAKHENHSHNGSLEQYFSMMETSIHKLDDTVKEILDYSRNARQNITIEQIDLRKLIDDNFDKMQFMPGVQNIERHIEVNEQAPYYSDQYRLSVIMNNLVSNAIKYYDPNKEHSFINIFVHIDPMKATIEFQDNGIGIDEKYIEKVFDMFFRGTEKNKGAGLGLYIVKEAVEKLKGKIDIQSRVGHGTTFVLELPNFLSSNNMINNNRMEAAY